MPYINVIGLATAPFAYGQDAIFNFLCDYYQIPDEDLPRVTRFNDRCEIETRFSILGDFGLPPDEWTFFNRTRPVSIEQRMACFNREATALGIQAIQDALPNGGFPAITHLLTVSCTGMSAPGLDLQLMRALSLPTGLHRSSVNFMGCYAAIHALKYADAICRASPNAVVLIVDVELCTLHFQDVYSMDNMASSLLFSDGAAAAIVSNDPGPFQIHSFASDVAFQGYTDMSWDLSSTGFNMKLSTYVPAIIGQSIKPMLEGALNNMLVKQEQIRHWAIHPGGRKILDEIEKSLQLSPADLQPSREVLRQHGNMSSVTLWFVLHQIMQNIDQQDEFLFAAAFGPGLTIETMLLST